MLQKENRLKKRSAFAATYRTGKTFYKDGVTIFLGKEKDSVTPTKIGFVVSKKVHKRAVKRNRIKRLMRECVRLMIKEGAAFDKYRSVIIAASSALLGKNFSEINVIMKKLVSKL